MWSAVDGADGGVEGVILKPTATILAGEAREARPEWGRTLWGLRGLWRRGKGRGVWMWRSGAIFR